MQTPEWPELRTQIAACRETQFGIGHRNFFRFFKKKLWFRFSDHLFAVGSFAISQLKKTIRSTAPVVWDAITGTNSSAYIELSQLLSKIKEALSNCFSQQ